MKSTAPRPALPKEVEALRASLDTRLTALEKALADPRKHGSLEALILDLARAATDEADATARNAVLDAQKNSESVAATARSEAIEALEAEKVESAALRQVIDQAKSALKQAEATLKEERRAAEAAHREASGAHRELAAVREAMEQQQSSSAGLRSELDAARAAVNALEQQVAQARSQSELERVVLAGELEQHNTALEGERAAAAQLVQASSQLEADLSAVRGELSAAREELDAVRRDLDGARGERDAARDERDASRRDLDAVRGELDGLRQDVDARAHTLSHSQAEQEQALTTARDAARSAEARLQQEIHERDTQQQETAELQQRLETAESTIRERDAALRQLQAAHEARDAAEVIEAARAEHADVARDPDPETEIDLNAITREEERQVAIEKRTRALELALRDAEMRAEAAEVELDYHRHGTPEPAAGPPAAPAPPAPEGADQFRGPARGARRVTFKPEPDIQVEGTPGKLVDLSMTGAQVLTPSAVNPNRLISVTVPIGDGAIVCKAKVAWARLEPRGGQLWYRAGVSFTSVDQEALETYLTDNQK